MTFPRVDILLATYNGSAYLDEQLQSLIDQDYPNFKILIRDDGSIDNTKEIIKKWAQQFPETISSIQDGENNLGATGNFSRLMENSSAPYCCFSDQDDRWLSSKVSQQLQAILELESGNKEQPAMVFSDLAYCDAQLNILHPSLNKKDHLNPKFVSANRLLMQNVPYGCTIMANQALIEKARPIPGEALLHDHWLSISAALLGRIGYVNDALILHRVHDANASRANSVHKKETRQDLGSKVGNVNFHNYLFKQVDQARALLEKYQTYLTEEQVQMINDFIRLKNLSGFQRKALIIKHQFFKNTLTNTLKLIVRA